MTYYCLSCATAREQTPASPTLGRCECGSQAWSSLRPAWPPMYGTSVQGAMIIALSSAARPPRLRLIKGGR